MNYGVKIECEPGHEAMARTAARRAFRHFGEFLSVELVAGSETRLIHFEEWEDHWPEEIKPVETDLSEAPHLVERFAIAFEEVADKSDPLP